MIKSISVYLNTLKPLSLPKISDFKLNYEFDASKIFISLINSIVISVSKLSSIHKIGYSLSFIDICHSELRSSFSLLISLTEEIFYRYPADRFAISTFLNQKISFLNEKRKSAILAPINSLVLMCFYKTSKSIGKLGFIFLLKSHQIILELVKMRSVSLNVFIQVSVANKLECSKKLKDNIKILENQSLDVLEHYLQIMFIDSNEILYTESISFDLSTVSKAANLIFQVR
jgi:hypothetical protein